MAAAPRDLPKLGTFWTTFYYVPNENSYPNTQTETIHDVHGAFLSKVNAKFKRDVDIEGTGILRSGPTINYVKRGANGEILYRISRVRWGWGIGTCALRPYHSMAVDPKIIPLGTEIYAPAAKGMRLPDGSLHDGIFYAEDIGQAINKHHVDLFAQEGESSAATFESAGIHTGTFIELYKVNDPDPNGCHTKNPESKLKYIQPEEYKASRANSFIAAPVVAGAGQTAIKVSALRLLADEYAATQNVSGLSSSLAELNELRESYEKSNQLEPDNAAVQAELASSRLRIEAVVTQVNAAADILKRSTAYGYVAVSRSGYDHDFNGSTLGPKEVVITFDDGPHKRLTPQVHEVVKRLHVPAAFFEVGENVEASPEITKALAEDGFVIANHSFDHPNMVKLSDASIRSQVDRTQTLIQKAIGGPDSFQKYFQMFFQNLFTFERRVFAPEFFRSPYGSRSARTMRLITETKVADSILDPKTPLKVQADTLYHVLWNVDSLDWNDHSPAGIERRVFNELATYGNHGVILFHDIHPQTLVAIQSILPRLQREGFKLVSLYDMLKETESRRPSL